MVSYQHFNYALGNRLLQVFEQIILKSIVQLLRATYGCTYLLHITYRTYS